MKKTLLLITCISLIGCTQDNGDVVVENKGHLFYGEDGIQKASFTQYAPSQLSRYHPDPYKPDYSVRNGRVDFPANSPASASTSSSQNNLNSYSNSQSNASTSIISVESKDLSAPALTSPSNISPIKPQARISSSAPRSTFIVPVQGDVVSTYGKRPNGAMNEGVNYMLPAGEPVFASASGEVAYVGDELKSYGTMAIIKHENGYNTSYAHLSRSVVSKGDRISQGDIIGYVGQTGNVDKPQLHFAIRNGSDPVDPNTLLPQQMAAN